MLLLYVRPFHCPLLETCIFNSVILKTVTQAEQEGKLFGRLAFVLLALSTCQYACLGALANLDFADCPIIVQLLALCVFCHWKILNLLSF